MQLTWGKNEHYRVYVEEARNKGMIPLDRKTYNRVAKVHLRMMRDMLLNAKSVDLGAAGKIRMRLQKRPKKLRPSWKQSERDGNQTSQEQVRYEERFYSAFPQWDTKSIVSANHTRYYLRAARGKEGLASILWRKLQADDLYYQNFNTKLG